MQRAIGTRVIAWVEQIILSLRFGAKRTRSSHECGEPIDLTSRTFLEHFFGYELGKVRLHRGQQAEQMSQRLGARAFTFSGQVFGPRHNLDVSKAEGLGLLAHELTHVIQQTQPPRVPQDSVRNEPWLSHSYDAKMVWLAPMSSPPANPEAREAQAQAVERIVAESAERRTETPSQINIAEVADKVYRLMQIDLVLERERTGR